MADQRDDAVRKGAPCAWPIHYHRVFPVKYRKALLDEAVTTIIQETAAELQNGSDRDGSDGDGQESHPSALQRASQSGSRPNGAVQRLTAREIFRRKPAVKRVLWGGEFWTDGYYVAGRGAGQLADRRTVGAAARATAGRSPAAPNG